MSDAPDFPQMATPGTFPTEGAPDHAIPENPMTAIAAMRLAGEELAVGGIPERNLATFVTTWMEPEARWVINENLHRNFIDHAEYPQTFEIQQRCIRMLAELFHAPGETTGTSTQGSSEAIMLGALSLKWKWRQVRSINASGHKFGLVYPGVGWLIFREKSDLAEDLVFYENYLGKTDATFTLNFSTGSSMVLAQYYNFVRFGKAGYRRIMEIMQENAQSLAKDIEAIGKFQIVGAGEETLPLVAFNLAEEHPYDEFDIAFQLAAERGWMIPAYTMPPNAHDVKMMRALVKLNLSRSLVNKLDDDIAEAIKTLEEKGPVSESERKLVKTSVTH
jgi:glutamate/tyrosine decarboxylase-like PLP-dependent enzyme